MVSPSARVFPGRGLLLSAGSAFVLYFLVGLHGGLVLFFALVGFLAMGGLAYGRLLARTLPRDIWLAKNLAKLMKESARLKREGTTIPDLFSQTARKTPDKPAVINVLDGRQMSFRQLEEASNQVGHYFLSKGFGKGDVVAVYMENSPEYLMVLLGLGKIGVIASLINYNLRKDALVHCISISNSRAIIFSAALEETFLEALPHLGAELAEKCYSINGLASQGQARSLEAEIADSATHAPPTPPNKSFSDYFCYIYTSGTTGMPKACKIRHERFFSMSYGQGLFSEIKQSDILFCSLPLYHSNCGILCAGQMMIRGATIVVRKKFSASHYWTDCIKYRCTVVYYIGEVCRYLLAQPKRPADTQHCVRMATGNGLRAKIWEEFQNRFNIGHIAEFYGSTEGNVGIMNCHDRVGAVGAISVVFSSFNPVSLLKIANHDTGELFRNEYGFCEETDFNEPGECVGAINEKIASRRFDGYQDDKATQQKIIRNVFRKGDIYFLSGDILRMDEDGFLFFCDRTGDTYRWKGENVAATEVEGVMMSILELRDVIVYGVEVPGCEGRAGMATIARCEKTVDISSLANQLHIALPPYAVPLFVRLTESTELTGSFKFRKGGLRSEGFSLDLVTDPLFFLHPLHKSYVPFTRQLFHDLEEGQLRV